jgi:CBS domain-containing protein
MRASEIMTTVVVTVGPDTSVRAAAAAMAEHRVTSVPVVDEDGCLVGIVSEVDLIRDRLPQDPRSHLAPINRPARDPARTVGEVMTDVVECLGPNADTADVASLMLDNDIRAIPIVDGGALLGIVSRRDLLRTLLRPDHEVAADVRHRLQDLAAEPGWSASVRDGVAVVRGTFVGRHQRDAVARTVSTVPGVLRVHLEED